MSAAAATATVEDALRLLHEPGEVFEVRILNTARAGTVSGYFDDPAAAAQAVAKWDGKVPGVYATLNPVRPDLRARACNRLKERSRETTSDADVTRRRWLLIDVDAERPAGISATDEEWAAARRLAEDIGAHLAAQGWPAGVLADSGNGAHLLYRIDLPNDAEARDLVSRCLAALAAQFNADGVHVDTAVFNAARIAKVPSTMVCKGDNLPERPHRRAGVLTKPKTLTPVPAALLTALAGPAKATQESGSGNGGGPFDVEKFMARHGLAVRKHKTDGAGDLWELEACPFNPEHDSGEAFVSRTPGGALLAGCHHNSCTWHWGELHDKYEPGYRERRLEWDRGRDAALAKDKAARTYPDDRSAPHVIPADEGGAPLPDEAPAPEGFELRPLDWQALLREGVPEIEYIREPYFPRGARIWVWGATGSYKSLWAEHEAAALSRNGVRVSYFQEENPIQEELRRLAKLRPDPAYFRLFHRSGMDLLDERWAEALLQTTRGDEIVFLDSFTDLWSGDEGDNRAVQMFDAAVLKPLQRQGVTPVVLHHTGHRQMFSDRGGATAGRGASSLGQKADVVLEFKSAGEDLFTIVYGKCRIGGLHHPERSFKVEDSDDGTVAIVETVSPAERAAEQLSELAVKAVLTAPRGYLTTNELRVAIGGGKSHQTGALALLEDDSRVRVGVEKVQTKDGRSRDSKVWRPAGGVLEDGFDFDADGGVK